MSGTIGSQLDDISKYLERIRDQKRNSEVSISNLEREREAIDAKIDELKRRRDSIDDQLQEARARLGRQDRTIEQGEATYRKLLDSSQSLADFVRKEYQENRH